MKILSWNCQGLGSRWTISYLREIWNKAKPEFMFLSETKQSRAFVQQFQHHFGYDYLHTVEPIGASGGLALFYNKTYDIQIIQSNNRIIDIGAVVEGKQVNISFVYGDPVQRLRDQVWERLLRYSIGRDNPWAIIGDLNEITGNHEKEGGPLRHASSFLAFNNMISNCDLFEFPSVGNTFSWRGIRNGQTIRCRLDRALANDECHSFFPFSFVEYLGMVGSDHKPILATMDTKKRKSRAQFRFDKRWIGKEGLMDTISQGWVSDIAGIDGCIVEKIKRCRHALSVWRKQNVPAGRERVSELQKALEEVQNDNTRTEEEVRDVMEKLKEAYRDEELYWQQKSRNLWYKSGDRNTKFYHAVTKQQRVQNRIVGLYNQHEVWVTKDTEVEDVAINYFSELFMSASSEEVEVFLEEVPVVITDPINEKLTKIATEEEVRKALFMMHPEKAPGPDGMTALFYQQAWPIIKKDLLELVNNFLQTSRFDQRLNWTNICLIPKTARPNRMTELRPISLCNVGYKIISKVLCQRLKEFLPGLISETQSAFVSGRLISDNILVAQELFHGLRTNQGCQSKFMAIKTDMSKAYDRVEWVFIEKLLAKMGFAPIWISWVMRCISSVQYRVLINGTPRGRIIPERGLRQGDPLSPYLFILVTEALIANFRRAEREKRITGIKIARSSPSISHLLFADDSLFFCQTKREECYAVLQILKKYEAASGQQINFDKSSVQFGYKVTSAVKGEMQQILGISKTGGMGSYLGIPESLGGPKTQVFSFVYERLQARINSWTSIFLSKGGKEILIKSVLTALPTYVMSCYRLPKTVTKKLTSAISRFWWSASGNNKGMHWLAWTKLCRHKQQGGLGFRNIDDFNTALLAKQLWRLMEKPESLFAKVFKSRYFRNSDPMDPIRSYSPSYGWKSIISARSLVKK